MEPVAPSDELIIRRMLHTDLDSVMYVERRAYQFGWTRSTFRSCLKSGNECWVIAPTEPPNVSMTIGHAVFMSVLEQAELLNITIDPRFQGQGLGRSLLDHVLHRMRIGCIQRVFLEVRESNLVAQRLYENSGFEKAGIRKDYYPSEDGREDAIVLELRFAS